MKELVIRVTQDSFDKTSRWLEVSHNGGAAWSTVLINNDEEAFQIIHALQQSVQPTKCPVCLGKGNLPVGASWLVCSACHGTGIRG